METRTVALKIAILKSGMTSRSIAQKVGISESYLSKWVNGKLELPREREQHVLSLIQKGQEGGEDV